MLAKSRRSVVPMNEWHVLCSEASDRVAAINHIEKAAVYLAARYRGRIMKSALIAACVSLGVLSAIAVPAPAQEAAACEDVAPRDAEFFAQTAATAIAEEDGGSMASPVASPTAFTLPEGETASEEVVAEVTTLYQRLASCLNSGDYLRVYALYTDDYLIRNLDPETFADVPATPVAVEESQQTTFNSVLDANVLEDGRIAALISTTNAQTGDVVLFSLLKQGEEGWQIDEEAVVEVEAQASPMAEATPAG